MLKRQKKTSKRKSIKKKNPEDFEIILKNLIDKKQKVQIQYTYGSFYFPLKHTHSRNAYTLDTKDRSIFFYFLASDIKKILSENVYGSPTIVLK